MGQTSKRGRINDGVVCLFLNRVWWGGILIRMIVVIDRTVLMEFGLRRRSQICRAGRLSIVGGGPIKRAQLLSKNAGSPRRSLGTLLC
jgi:hypothetical protein